MRDRRAGRSAHSTFACDGITAVPAIQRANVRVGSMEIQFLYFDDCPNWHTARERLSEVLGDLGEPPVVEMIAVISPHQAEQLGFLGSPSILVDGRDVFAAGGEPVGMSCRVYQTPDGPKGSPTVDQLRAVIG